MLLALDTDVASDHIRNRLDPLMATAIRPFKLCVTLVTVAELSEWSTTRSWGGRSLLNIDSWLSRIPKLWCDEDTARTWGRLPAANRRIGRPRPVNDRWNAACRPAQGLPPATMNVKGHQPFADSPGLTLIAPGWRPVRP